MKIVIGTVQFGLKYGISNIHGIPSDFELQSIFELAKQSGIQQLDTAKLYGNAEERIGLFNDYKFEIISKFSNINSVTDFGIELSRTLKNLNVDCLYGYISHNPDTLLKNRFLWDSLLNLKNQNKVRKIGYSIYTPDQLNQLLDMNFIPDLVQLPYSIFDRKFDDKLTILKQLGTEVHVRSIFLQGLYLMNPKKLPQKLKSFQKPLMVLNNLCTDYNVTIAEVALNYVNNNPKIDKLVLGIETANQLKENIQNILNWKSNRLLFEAIEAIEIKDTLLLNPINW